MLGDGLVQSRRLGTAARVPRRRSSVVVRASVCRVPHVAGTRRKACRARLVRRERLFARRGAAGSGRWPSFATTSPGSVRPVVSRHQPQPQDQFERRAPHQKKINFRTIPRSQKRSPGLKNTPPPPGNRLSGFWERPAPVWDRRGARRRTVPPFKNRPVQSQSNGPGCAPNTGGPQEQRIG